MDMSKNKTKPCEYIMPDGSELLVNEERFKAPEILFDPSKAGLEHLGIHELIVSSINKLEIELRKNLYESIHLAGGNTNIAGKESFYVDVDVVVMVFGFIFFVWILL
jgi:centractin